MTQTSTSTSAEHATGNGGHALFPAGQLVPFILVTALFFLWGIPSSLNDVLIRQFMKSFEITRFRAALVQSAFYMGYFLLAMPAAFLMRRAGYKIGFVAGLLLFGGGCFLFWPAALAGSYGFFLCALFVIASGLSFLETASNPFIAQLGDPDTSERRLNFSQAFNPLGAITAALVGTVFIFSGVELSPQEISVQKAQGLYQAYLQAETLRVIKPYLVIGAVAIFWALLIMRTKFPAIQSEHEDDGGGRGRFWDLFGYPHFLLAVVAQFLYVGAQVGTWSYFIQYVQEATHQPEKIAGYFLTGTLAAFGVGRFTSAYLMRSIAPNKLMGAYCIANVVLVGLGVAFPGWFGLWCVFLTSFFMSLMFPTIFAMGLKGLGPNTKLGGSLLVMAIVGGAVLTPVMGLISEAAHSVAAAYSVPLVAYIFIALYSFYGAKQAAGKSDSLQRIFMFVGKLLSGKVALSLLVMALSYGVLPLAVRAQTTDANAPTAGTDPLLIDRTWQKASTKYDAARAALLKDVDRVDGEGPFRPDWESLQNYKAPEWYMDAKFGIFIHWGVYSVPAYANEWYPRNMYLEGTDEYKHHIATFGTQDKFGYKDFIPRFKAEKFDPAAWARMFKDAGARYVVPVFEHHDGFAMYDSGLSDWTAAKMGPHRDLMGDLAKAIRAEGMHLGASSHRVEHNFFLGVGRDIRSDVNDPQYAEFYGPAHHWMEAKNGTNLANDFTFVSKEWTDDWLARSAEIVEKYHPDMIYFDWWIGQPSVRANLTRFAAFYYNSAMKNGGPLPVIDYKEFAMQDRSAVLDVERGQLARIRTSYWQTDTSVSNRSWGYIENDTFKSPEFIVRQLVDIVSKNGNLLLNVGPRSDGTFPDEVQQVLHEVGAWLKVNGDAIYGTRPWTVYGEGPTKVTEGAFHDTETKPYTAEDFRFTKKGETLYAIELGWPANHEAVIHALGTSAPKKVKSVGLLGGADVSFEQREDGLHIQVPEQAPGKFAYAFRITFN